MSKNTYYDNMIDKIQQIRKKNNKLWMDILRIAFAKDPHKAKKIMKNITKNDLAISELSSKLGNNLEGEK